MKYLLFFVCFVLIAVVLGLYADKVEGQTYSYEVQIEVENPSATAYTDKRVLIEDFPSLNLINNGYMQNDADDCYLSDGQVTANTLGVNDATWYISSIKNFPRYSTNIMSIFIGNPLVTRNQQWCSLQDDFNQSWDSATLDVNASSGIQVSADVYLDSAPTITGTENWGYIGGKPGAYELYIDGTPAVVFRVWEPSSVYAGTPIFYPDNDCLSNGTTTVACITGNGTYNYDIKELPIVPTGSEITSLTAYFQGRCIAGSQPTVTTKLVSATGTVHATTPVPIVIGPAFNLYSANLPRANGEKWTMYDLYNRIQTYRLTIANNASAEISEAAIQINFASQPGTQHTITLPIATGTQIAVSGHYDNTEISLTVGGVTANDTLSFGDINTNQDYFIVGKYNGYLDNLKVSTGSPAYATDVLELTFEPEQINYFWVDDQSGNSNDCEFWMPDDGLNISFLGMTSTGETTELIAGAGVPDVAPVLNLDNKTSEEREEGQGNPIYNILLPFAQTSEELGTPVDITMFWWMLYIGILGGTVVLIGRYIPDLRPIAFATIFVTYIFWLWGPVPFYMLILNILIAMYSLGRESQKGAF